MGVRGELFSTKVSLQNRTYFFNVKENRLGDLYLNVVESKNRDEGGFERQSIILFAEDLQEFLQGFDESLRVMEKAIREKRRGVKSGSGGESRSSRAPAEDSGERSSPRARGRDEKTGDAFRGRRNDREGGSFRANGSPRTAEDPRGPKFREGKREGSRRPASREAQGAQSSRAREYSRKTDNVNTEKPTRRKQEKPSTYREWDEGPPKRRVVVRKGKKDV